MKRRTKNLFLLMAIFVLILMLCPAFSVACPQVAVPVQSLGVQTLACPAVAVQSFAVQPQVAVQTFAVPQVAVQTQAVAAQVSVLATPVVVQQACVSASCEARVQRAGILRGRSRSLSIQRSVNR